MSGASKEASQRGSQITESSRPTKPKKIKLEHLPYTLRYKHKSPTLTTSKVDYDWADIIDTNLGPFNYEELVEETFIEDATRRTKLIFQSGFTYVALFPLSVQCLELILTTAGAYNLTTRQCVDVQGNIIIDLTRQMIRFMFDGPTPLNPKQLNEAEASQLYSNHKEANKTHMNKKWMRVEKKSLTKLPDQPKRANFSKEIGDIIMMLSRVFGKRDS